MAAVSKLKRKDGQAAFRRSSLSRRRLVDYAARAVVTFGGIFIILSILAILVFISLEVYPLWQDAKVELDGRFNLNESPKVILSSANNPVSGSGFPILALGVEQYREIGFVIKKSGVIDFISLSDGSIVKRIPLEKLEGKRLASASGSLDNKEYALATEDGFVLPVEIKFNVSFTADSLRGVEPEILEEVIKPEEKEALQEEQELGSEVTGSIGGEQETGTEGGAAEGEQGTEPEGGGQEPALSGGKNKVEGQKVELEEKGLTKGDQKIDSGKVVVDPESVEEATEVDNTAGEEQETESGLLERVVQRVIEPEVVVGEPIRVANLPITYVTYEATDDDTKAVAAVTSDGRLILFSQQIISSLLGEGKKEEFRHDLTPELDGSAVTAVAMDSFTDNLYVGTERGKLYHWYIRDKKNPRLVDVIDAAENREAAITALGFLIGNRSLVVGDGAGNVSTWFQVRAESSPTSRRLKKIHALPSHDAPITAVAVSPRDKGFITADLKGNINLYHSTSEQKLLQMGGQSSPIKALAFAPKANGAVAVDASGTLYDWEINNPHPEATLKTLFGKVWYEGYDKPEYVWQSTGGTDDFEPKISLTPLVYGTLKGTFYALFFAIPLAILGAICVSQFMHPSLRNTIKPVIEIMAALPSVVLGFLAGLWMAPLVEQIVPAIFLMPPVLIVMTLISVFLWRLVPKSIGGRFKSGTEFLLLIPVFILGFQICLWLNDPIEALLLGGDYKSWLYDSLGLQYDQRNSLIVGFAMAFAVIPIIFTISEDALSNVPKHLSSGSLALGATKWQTAIRVVLPTAAAGIFSAVMIGFGRAVGETMIVLMATGNTPIMDWSIFNGFRALSANIAVEIPEAPHGGTLYRILFLAALLLFIITFLVNTAAEVVRQRLRKKYGQL